MKTIQIRNNSHILVVFIAVIFLVAFTGCVKYGHQFRDDNPPGDLSRKSLWRPLEDSKYYLAFIEFDDFGEFYDPKQLPRALELIREAKNASPTTNAKVITFIHGWKNNSSDKSGNVWGFRDELNEIAAKFGPEPVVGIYIGWRGAVTNVPVIKDLTFWNRRDAAIRIPAAHLTETLNEIMHETKSCIHDCTPLGSGGQPAGKGSLSVFVGHSFGGMVLERSITQSLVGEMLRQESEFKDQERRRLTRETHYSLEPPADLIALVNEAAPATESKQLLDMFKRHKMRLLVGGNEEPLLLSITSEGDAATAIAMPLGQSPSLLTKAMRPYDNPQPPEIKKQSTYYLHTTAHLPPLFSHSIKREQDKELESAQPDAQGHNLAVKCFTSSVLKERYCIVPFPNRYNDTPYWVMQMPRQFVPDHSTIFRPAFRELLEQFVKARFDQTKADAPLKRATLESH